MIKKMYAVFDKVAEIYSAPMVVRAEGEALRICKATVNDPQRSTQVAENPSDFALYALGKYDDSTGVLEPENPSKVIELVSLAESTADENQIDLLDQPSLLRRQAD